MPYLSKWLFSFVWIILGSNTSAQKIFFEQLTTAEGLPSDYINCMFEDSKGYLWIGTDKGACRYDGRQFQYFNIDNGLPSNFISCFAEDPSGNIWIGTIDRGLCKFDGKVITRFPLPGNNKINISGICFNKNNSFFIVVEKSGLYYFETEFSHPQFFSDMAFIKRIGPGLFITGSIFQFSLVEFKNRQPVFHPISQPAPETIPHHSPESGYFLYWLGDNRFISMKKKSFYEYTLENRQWVLKKEFSLNRSLPFPGWTSIKEIYVNNQELFVATANGLIYVDSGKYNFFFNSDNGLGTNFIKSVYKDYSNNIYICTYGAGIKIWPKRYLEEYKTNGKVTSIFSSGETSYVTTNKTIYRLQSSEKSFYEFKNIETGSFTSVFKDENDQLYLGTLNNFYKLPGENYLEKFNPGLKTKYSFDANSGTSGFLRYMENIYISTYGDGVFVFNGNKMVDTLNHSTDSSAPLIVESLVQLTNSFAALTYNSGLTIYNKDNKSVSLSRKNGLLSNEVYSVFQEKESEIWIGTQTGVNLYDGKKIIKTFSAANGLIGTKVICIFRDAHQRLWMLSDKYLHLLENDRLRAVRSHPVLFDKRSSINRAVFNLTTNTLYIGLTEALLTVDMSRIIPDTFVHNPELLAVKKDTAILTPGVGNTLSLSHPASKIIFQFKSLHYSVSRRSDLYYKLNGFDDEWKLLTEMSETVYPNLPPGDYKLMAKSVNPDGYESPEISLLKLEVLPPFWKRNWFITLSSVVLLGLVFYIGNHISRKRYKQKLFHLQGKYRLQLERERIARELHDNVGSQLTYLINKIDDDYPLLAVKEEAEKLSGFARGTMQELRETIWALDKKEVQWDDLENKIRSLIRLYKNEKHHAELEWKINNQLLPPLNPLEALNIYRIIQEALNNAEKYSNAGQVKVSADQDNGQLCVEIKDNGKGFNKQQPENGYGIKNMKKRAEEMNGELLIESNPGKGTTVRLRFS